MKRVIENAVSTVAAIPDIVVFAGIVLAIGVALSDDSVGRVRQLGRGAVALPVMAKWGLAGAGFGFALGWTINIPLGVL